MTKTQKPQPKTRRRNIYNRAKYQPLSFLLKLCKPLPEVPEETLKPREWQINKEELG